MRIDPRKPPIKKKGPLDVDVFVLLKLEMKDKPLYLVLEDLTEDDRDISFSELQEKERQLCEERCYSEDIVGAIMISYGGKTRTRGIFKFIEAI